MDETQKISQQSTDADNEQVAPEPTLMTSTSPDLLAAKKPSNWRYLFIILGSLQLAGVAIVLLSLLFDNSSWETSTIVFLFILLILMPMMYVVALINIIGLPIFMVKRKLRGKNLRLSIASLVISLAIGAYGIYMAYQIYIFIPRVMTQSMESVDSQNQPQEYYSENLYFE